MVIDVFSKYGWIVPLKDKKGESVTEAFKSVQLMDDYTWFLIFALLLGSRQLGPLRNFDELCHKDDFRVSAFSLQSVKNDSSRNVPTAFDLVNSERRHLGSSSTPCTRRRSYLTGKLNYYCNSFACFQLQRHAISGDIHLECLKEAFWARCFFSFILMISP